MIYVIDGSNVLGRMQLDRESAESKRELARAISRALKSESGRAILFFDGEQPENFRGGAERVAIRFGGRVSADDLIRAEVLRQQKCTVVTSDRSLAHGVAGRKAVVMEPLVFARKLEVERGEGRGVDDDWESFFSDEKNRNI